MNKKETKRQRVVDILDRIEMLKLTAENFTRRMTQLDEIRLNQKLTKQTMALLKIINADNQTIVQQFEKPQEGRSDLKKKISELQKTLAVEREAHFQTKVDLDRIKGLFEDAKLCLRK